jgi:hypothetical protein
VNLHGFLSEASGYCVGFFPKISSKLVSSKNSIEFTSTFIHKTIVLDNHIDKIHAESIGVNKCSYQLLSVQNFVNKILVGRCLIPIFLLSGHAVKHFQHALHN